MSLETPKMLVLSLAHIKGSTNSSFEVLDDDVPIFYTKLNESEDFYGYFIPITDWPHTCPVDLIDIRKLAEEHDCTWIMLDRDGPVLDQLLPTYEW